MYALSFDMSIADLKKHYGEPYDNAYFEIKQLLLGNGWFRLGTRKLLLVNH